MATTAPKPWWSYGNIVNYTKEDAVADDTEQWSYGNILSFLEYAAGLALEQEGFRFRDDDDSEAAAAWLALQDIDITRAKEINTRLRFLLNATGDQAAKQFKLQYKKTSDATWRDMPVN